jgi:predicted AAA+ superfamily ATPase
MRTSIERNKYLTWLNPFIDNEIIKVIIGQRRVGKSYFTRQIMDYVKMHNDKKNIVYINMEQFKFSGIINANDLVKYVDENSMAGENVLIIDEVQEIKEFEKAVRHFFNLNYDVYITGSNSELLSGELATMLSGRYIQFRIHPLDFIEFCKFHNLEQNQNALDLYIKFGGMPYLKNLDLENEEAVYVYLKNIYETILLKDVVARYNLKNIDFLERLVYFLADNIGSIVSAKKITDFLMSQKLKISHSVVLNYLNYMSQAFFINKAQRYDIQGKRFLEVGEKYYFTDVGIRNALMGFKPQDMNKIIENLVYSHLISLGYKVSVGKLNDYEIDFIAEKHKKKMYLQVAYLLSDEKTIAREFGNLNRINDNYPKYVISYDRFQFDDYQGISHLTLLNFLKNRDF